MPKEGLGLNLISYSFLIALKIGVFSNSLKRFISQKEQLEEVRRLGLRKLRG